jgi:hypothetical protein
MWCQSYGSGSCKASQAEDYHRVQSLVQYLLGSVELLVVKDSTVESNWESTDGQSKTPPLVLPHSKIKEVLTKLYNRSTRESCVSTKPWTRSDSGTASYTQRARLRGGSNGLKSVQHTKSPTQSWGLLNQHKGRAPLKRIATASARMKDQYYLPAKRIGFQEGYQVSWYCPTNTSANSPKLHPSWKALTECSPESTTRYTGSSSTTGRRKWWYTWSSHTYRLLGMSSLEKGTLSPHSNLGMEHMHSFVSGYFSPSPPPLNL